MITVIKNAKIYAPECLGVKDIVLVGDKIEGIYDHVNIPDNFIDISVIDAKGKIATPGFIDAHVHITGGGGEGGFKTRTPELKLSDAVVAGVTTVVGCLGTDGVCRDLKALVAKARGLDEEGITAYAYTGSYEVPVVTITGTVRSDIMLIDKMIGAGEIALADHRAAWPTYDQLVNVIAQARVGGMLSGKGGVVNIHMGEGLSGFDMLIRMAKETQVPITQVVPTHVNRNAALIAKGIEYAKMGGYIDLTASDTPGTTVDDTKASRVLKKALSEGVNVSQITMTSDGQGSLPRFDEDGKFVGLGVGSCKCLYEELRFAVLNEGVDFTDALSTITLNPARILKLNQKGRLAAGMDADINLLEEGTLELCHVIAKGRVMMQDGEVIVKGTFED